jgi:hypothetical protein
MRWRCLLLSRSSRGRHEAWRFHLVARKNIEWLLLRWLDRPIKSWYGASEKAMTDEYHLISNFLKKQIEASPNNIRTGTRTWRFKWGQLNLSYEVRSFNVAIFIEAR